MPTYTVIGVYDSTGEVFADQVEASGPHEAIAVSAAAVGGNDLQILGAIEGPHNMTAACEDSGKSAWACDLSED